MPTKGKKFISEFLIPNLKEKKFGSRLKWLNMKEGVFQLQWNHKSSADWKERDAEVFIEWDKMKGHYRPDEKEYYTKSKQRFRAVLYKLIRERQITVVGSKDKNTKIYCIGEREKHELEDVCFEFHSSPGYSVENPIESINEDHKYSLSEESVLENEDDISLYPAQLNSCHSLSKDPFQKSELNSILEEKPHTHLNYQQQLLGDQHTIYIDLIRSDASLRNESMEDLSLHQNIDENIFTHLADASFCDTTLQVSNLSELDHLNYFLKNPRNYFA